MKHMFFLAFLLLFCACGGKEKNFELIDASARYLVRDNYGITLHSVSSGKSDTTYLISETTDLLLKTPLRGPCSDDDSIYIYSDGKSYAASQINLADARLIKNWYKAINPPAKNRKMYISVAVLALIAAGVAAFSKIRDLFPVMLIFPVVMMCIAQLSEQKLSFFGSGILSELRNGEATVKAGRLWLQNERNMATGSLLYPGQNIYVYRIGNSFYASSRKFSEKTLRHTGLSARYPWQEYACWLIPYLLGYGICILLKKHFRRPPQTD